MKEVLKTKIEEYIKSLGLDQVAFSLEFPKDISHGDLMTNIPLVLSKQVGKNPREIAEELVTFLENEDIENVESIEIAGPGFINFLYTNGYLQARVGDILRDGNVFGNSDDRAGEHLVLEHSCPNAFKQFHIGHLMSNTIGESLGRIFASRGMEVTAESYGGDVGLHIAKALWGMEELKVDFPQDGDSLSNKTKFLGAAYAYGSEHYEDNAEAKQRMDLLNKQILEYLDGSSEAFDENLDVFFKKGRMWSLEHFKEIYTILNSDLQHHLYESEVTRSAREIIQDGLNRGIFEESDGAVIYSEERSGLHTRVFQNSHGVPTYEGKDLGHALRKDKMFSPYTSSIVITAEEQTEYFKVVLKALNEFFPEIAQKTEHVPHGFMKLPEGKMSSRKGTVVTGESLLFDVITEVEHKMEDRDIEESQKKDSARMIAVAALKYSILRSAPGSDIVFDREKALALDGDSGPYIQYTYTRAKSLMEKARDGSAQVVGVISDEGKMLVRLLIQFPVITERAYEAKAPHLITNYVTEIAHEFNRFYHDTPIIGSDNEVWLVSLTEATAQVLRNGLYLLGIEVPEKM